jgi:hypothetical protein
MLYHYHDLKIILKESILIIAPPAAAAAAAAAAAVSLSRFKNYIKRINFNYRTCC